MNRRTFLQTTPAVLGLGAVNAAEAPMPMATLGKTGLRVSRFVLGGYHMAVNGEENGVKMIHRAIDLGVNFFDSAHLYHDGRSDRIYGKALQGGLRKKVLLMSKAERYSRAEAMRELEETLQWMQTDYLDLWQCHQVVSHKEVDQILGPNGSLEAFAAARKQGKVRHIGFTGHADPTVHQRLLDSFDGWETVQHPVNLIDPHYLSFINSVLPNIRKKGLGVLAMKTNAIGGITRHKIATIPECLRFAWSQDVDVVVSGAQTLEELEQNVAVCKSFVKMTPQEISALLERTRKGPHGVQVENYKRKPESAACPPHRDGDPA
ncbi:MAG: aldo/keto reductase [Bryobacterales bacterium]|nr:aldo/keto reductase [Bryobacterales bacterium]